MIQAAAAARPLWFGVDSLYVEIALALLVIVGVWYWKKRQTRGRCKSIQQYNPLDTITEEEPVVDVNSWYLLKFKLPFIKIRTGRC